MRRCKIILALLFLISTLTVMADETVSPPFIGIGYSKNEEPPGLKITQVVRHSAAEIAGLKENDIVLSMDGQDIPDGDALKAFLETVSPGTRVRVAIDRCGEEMTIYLILGRREDYLGPMKDGGRELFPDNADSLYPNWQDDSLTALVLETITNAGMADDYDKLAVAFQKELDGYHGHYTLDAVALCLLQPAATYVSGEKIMHHLNIYEGQPSDIWTGVPEALDLNETELTPVLNISTLGDLIEVVKLSNIYIDSAFVSLTDEERQDIADYGVFLLGNFAETGYLHTESDEELLDGYYELLKSTKKIDYAMLIKAGQLLSNIHNSSILELLRDIKPAEGADPSRDILIDKFVTLGYRDSADVKIPLKGRFIVSGGEGMTYPEEAAIWIDLGGDDTYFGFCGGTPYTIYKNYRHRFGAGRSGLHIDLGGNDTYIRNTEGAIGAGFCGAGCLIDLDGDDRYSGYRLCQGAAFCGTGMLIDMSGSDIYTSQEESQGFAVFGAGLLYDAAGNDLYSGTRFVQGVGVTKGIGLLVDNSGDDRYVGTFKTPNGYGVENTWDGWSQGVGVGFRSVATGGIGLICDRAGNDRYEAGNFSQACGYFFGMGIFQDFDGNDLVIGNRYCQGSGAHQAASLFRDHRGNDRYIGHEATNQAGVWDITAAYFIDDLGDDIYEASSISLGGASQNGFAAFLDGDGCDSYTSLAGATVGAGGGNHYHPEYGAKSLGIFIDLGGDKDDYTKTFEKRKNDKLIISGDDEKEEGGEGIFRDN